MSMNLFMAIYHEHKARTGHDIYKRKPLTYINCDVCLYLDAEKRVHDQAEARHYQDLEDQAGALPRNHTPDDPAIGTADEICQ